MKKSDLPHLHSQEREQEDIYSNLTNESTSIKSELMKQDHDLSQMKSSCLDSDYSSIITDRIIFIEYSEIQSAKSFDEKCDFNQNQQNTEFEIQEGIHSENWIKNKRRLSKFKSLDKNSYLKVVSDGKQSGKITESKKKKVEKTQRQKSESVSIPFDTLNKMINFDYSNLKYEEMKEKLFSAQMKNYKLSIALKEKDLLIDNLLSQIEVMKSSSKNSEILTKRKSETPCYKTPELREFANNKQNKKKSSKSTRVKNNYLDMIKNYHSILKNKEKQEQHFVKIDELLMNSVESTKPKTAKHSHHKWKSQSFKFSQKSIQKKRGNWPQRKKKKTKQKQNKKFYGIKKIEYLPVKKIAKKKMKKKISVNSEKCIEKNLSTVCCEDNKTSSAFHTLERQEKLNFRKMMRKISYEGISKYQNKNGIRTRMKSDQIVLENEKSKRR